MFQVCVEEQSCRHASLVKKNVPLSSCIIKSSSVFLSLAGQTRSIRSDRFLKAISNLCGVLYYSAGFFRVFIAVLTSAEISPDAVFGSGGVSLSSEGATELLCGLT